MPSVPRPVRRLSVVVLLALLVVGAAAYAAARLHERKLSALFDGPEETAPALTPAGFSPRPIYHLEAWRASPADESTPSPLEDLRPRETVRRYEYVDGADRDRFEAMMRQASRPSSPLEDATTGATKLVRLQCPSAYRESCLPSFLTVTHPTDNAVFPPNLCAPWIEWSDARNDLWQVTVRVGNELLWTGLSSERRCAIDDAAWARITSATVTVKGVKRSGLWGKERPGLDVSRPVSFTVSQDPADAAIVYRLVDPPFAKTKTPDMFVRQLDEKEPRLFFRARGQYCVNCHAFAQGPPGKGVERMAVQVRYLGRETSKVPVYFAVVDFETGGAVRAALPFKTQMTTFMAWAPDGRRLAYSANQSLVTLPPVIHETQFAGEPSSDIAVYDASMNATWLAPGASEPGTLEIYPRWTPDGKSIVFSRAPAGMHPALTQYQLWVVPVEGPSAGRARPVEGAQDPRRSSYFARFSPDGKWLTFVRSDGGSLIKSSSDIWIMPGDLSGKARPLESNVPFAADSWHAWSSNSRWIVFASKRDDGVYARLYLAHVDANGRASPAVQLPVAELPLMSFNIPEFVTEPPRIRERDLYSSVGIHHPATLVKEQPANRSAP